ncbi:SMI1/KNR4 family protein [Tenacibaculum sp. 1B UA]|uniref:SMI1/KNR4 family protein n=1 Tax=Tenacibaculum sp. 1B UA TaxID=2922252 RepID=UPI002A24648A|nr:SMI1/KNR4 family protein [Tenacibaculum sp. 1B UA]MDX8552267.1 SMI1/KNR4 family protein [Tenacibaculum sp. 1B UA]
MEIKYYIILGIFSAAVAILRSNNRIDSEKIEKKKAIRNKATYLLDKFRNSPDYNHLISKSIIRLLENYHFHENVGKTLTDEEIKIIEEKLILKLPKSYKIFLKYFGDGGDWIFVQNIDNIQNGGFYKEYDYNNTLKEYVYLGEEKIITESLLSLMSEDSNGGAWCWLTHEEKKDNEWSLAYYIDGCLHYKVKNFTEWLEVAASDREVIREYDVEEKLGLG